MTGTAQNVDDKNAEIVMKQRGGSVLGKRTILKSDHFPGCQNRKITPEIAGAPNYRQAVPFPVHGVAIPSIDGIRNVLKHVGAWKDSKLSRVLWFNLREEPLVYINGRPFVLRDVEKPFSNLEFTGIDRVRVEEMEIRLKNDVLAEASRFGNNILISDELPNGQMVDLWEAISQDSVKTPLEVYQQLQEEGFLYDYERVPITDEKAPEEQDFDTLVEKIYQVNKSTDIIFNCQQGRGRTTTGMVIASLIYLNRVGSSGISRTNTIGRIFDVNATETNKKMDSDEAILRGEYGVIRSLTRVLEGGVDGKKQVDKVIDICCAMQNLREVIASYRSKVLTQTDELKREASLFSFVESLDRYYFLICFAVYIDSERDSLSKSASFSLWMKARPELYSITRRLLRKDPIGALGNSKTTSNSNVLASRNGQVLGSQTMLKSDRCVVFESPRLKEDLKGAPNFREVKGFRVYGVANPTIDGVISVLERVGGPVFWQNMREEPVVYINAKPFVLREVERPYKNMVEYTGIDCERVEKMECRLKEDILTEARQYEGKIMVTQETEDGEIVFDAWETVSPDSVKTPREVFESLASDGFPLKYARVPITDGEAPQTTDFDDLTANIVSASKDTAFVFNCQMGGGRTTTGTVIACLIKQRLDFGRPLRILSDDSPVEESDNGRLVIDDIPIVRKITRLFENGPECRAALDSIIDRCAAPQNIRQDVLHQMKEINQQTAEESVRRAALQRGAEHLERYFWLITFAAYIGSEAFDDSETTFQTWVRQNPDIQAMKWNIRKKPAGIFTLSSDDKPLETIIDDRNGSVLGQGSILKVYFFPGQRTSVDGSPLTFQANGFPVYSMASPTAAGAKEILSHVTATCRTVILTDLREETVVYINGTPFVVRDRVKPFDPIKHVGMTGVVGENMEAKLKEEILLEAGKFGGKILVHREETDASTNQPIVVGYWETIRPDGVKTPAEVYEGLKGEGFDVVYRRVPLTRQRGALAAELDAIQCCEGSASAAYLFLTHTGHGGVAYAMAIMCLKLGGEIGGVCGEIGDENRDPFTMGEYRDILSLTRVLAYGPESKIDVDFIINKCAGAGNVRDDIYNYRRKLMECTAEDDEQKALLNDMGIKALRRYFFLIAFKSYLYSSEPIGTTFSAWIDARPELHHLCRNLSIHN